ncbi:MAG: 4a-hydroxytetrahydrobiopterin dehydratase [Candidatus Staskawiczbacteria bacterium]|nr:4a-hydroxytetrahydrobiopterin dehydratase [Candidatus Staskawiczbacteria bacterium]
MASKKCVPCEGGVPALTDKEIKEYMTQLKEKWEVLDPPLPEALAKQATKIQKLFKFKDFKEAMVFVNKVADLAESEGHHPDISINYNKVNIVIWTHAIGGLHENDFILAAKIDNID